MANGGKEGKKGGFPYGSLEISVVKLRLRLLEEAVLPPFKGSTLRGALGTSLLTACCPNRKEMCFRCQGVSQCSYANFFEPHLASGGKSAPVPFLVEPPADRRTHLSRGDTLEFRLNVFGTAVRWLPFVMAAMSRAGETGLLGPRRARFRLEQPCAPSRASEPSSWAEKGIESLETRSASELTGGCGPIRRILMVTPCKLKEDGRVQGEPDGRLIATGLERRVRALHYFYSGEVRSSKLEWDEEPFLQTGEGRFRWVVLERPSVTQQERVNIGGWVGTLDVEAHNEAAAALLRVGQWVHLGKNTVLGCGKILLEESGRC